MLTKKQINLIIGLVTAVVILISILINNNKPIELNNDVSPTPRAEVIGEAISSAPPNITGADSLPNKIFYRVAKVVDGDTIDVSIEGKTERLRLIGINTPETVDPRKPVECFGHEASNKAKEILNGQYVALEDDPTQSSRDKYGRLLRYVFLPDGTNYNLYMIENGYAYEYTYDNPYKYQKVFKTAQEYAQQKGLGLWSSATCSGKK